MFKGIWSKWKIKILLLPHTCKWYSTFSCWYCVCRMCWRYTLKLYLSRLKLSHAKRYFNLNVIWMWFEKCYDKLSGYITTVTCFINAYKCTLYIFSIFCFSYKGFLRWVACRLLFVNLILWNPLMLLLFLQWSEDYCKYWGCFD